MQDVHSQQLNPPGEERQGYGKQVWLLFHPSILVVSLIQLSGGLDIWRAHSLLCALTHPLPPKWEIINTHQSNTR